MKQETWWLQQPIPPYELDPKYNLAGFEAAKQARTRRLLLASCLASEPTTRRLGQTIQGCNFEERCGLSICPSCFRQFRRRWLIPSLVHLIDAYRASSGTNPVAISAVPLGYATAEGELQAEKLRRVLEASRKKLQRNGILGSAALGIDISWNEPVRGEGSAYWQPHIYGLLFCKNRHEQLRRSLADVFPADTETPTPLRLCDVKDAFATASYIAKPFFTRRIRYVAGNGRLNTRKLPLRPAQLREVSSVLAELPPTGRLHFIGLRRRGARLVPI